MMGVAGAWLAHLLPGQAVEPAIGPRMLAPDGPFGTNAVTRGVRRSQRSRLVIDRTSLYWGLLTILVLAVLFSSYLIG